MGAGESYSEKHGVTERLGTSTEVTVGSIEHSEKAQTTVDSTVRRT